LAISVENNTSVFPERNIVVGVKISTSCIKLNGKAFGYKRNHLDGRRQRRQEKKKEDQILRSKKR